MQEPRVEFIDVLVGENYAIRETTMDGRRYIIVPIVSLVQGVHNGIRHTPEEMARFVSAWNGIPIIIDHVYDGETPVSANTPEAISNQGVGQLFGTSFDAENNRLMHQAWIEVDKIQRVSPVALSAIKARRHLEVSIGTFGEYDGIPGEWNGEAYRTSIRAYRPDHLALLPGKEGACNWTDGCGVRANSEEGKMSDKVLSVNVLATARTPSFSGAESVSWASVDKSFGAYRDAYYRGHGGEPADGAVGSVADAPAAMKAWIAAKSLLGEPTGATERDLIFFPVVNPSTGKLNGGALRAVLGGRAAQADIPAAAKTSAQNKARALLNQHFGTQLEADESGGLDALMARLSSLKLATLAAEMSHGEIADKLRGQLDAMDSESMMYFLEDVFDKHFIYRVRGRDMGTGATIGKSFKRSYAVDPAGAVTLADDTQEVTEQTEYVPVAAASVAAVPAVATQTKEVTVSVSEDQKARVDALIACKCTRFEEGDRTWLSALSAEQLDKMKVDPPKDPVVPATLEAFVATAPDAFKPAIESALAASTARKDAVVRAVLANARNKFTEPDLRAMQISALENLTVLGNVPVSYEGQGGGPKIETAPAAFKNEAPAIFALDGSAKPTK